MSTAIRYPKLASTKEIRKVKLLTSWKEGRRIESLKKLFEDREKKTTGEDSFTYRIQTLLVYMVANIQHTTTPDAKLPFSYVYASS